MSVAGLFPMVEDEEEADFSSSTQWRQGCRHFSFDEIQLATQNFDESLVIGHGGFGKVYKGMIINGASRVVAAVKRLDSTSNQGAVEFWAEVEMLSKLRHCHLVSLIGYCNDRLEMILVYEYLPRGTLADHLHKLYTPLSWVRRLKICIGAARGLDYLHTGTGIRHGVIHRDVKSSNILLEKSWAAKISDFGLSKIGPTNQPSTHVSTLVKGTFGYLDPDYFSTGRLSRKSDVYAFGVLLFEVLCRKNAVDSSLDEDQWGLARWAQDSIKEGRLKEIVDPILRGKILPKCLKEFARLADRCLHSHPKQRPTMAEVVVGLGSILALQEKTNNSMHPAGMKIFGRKVPTLLFPSSGKSSGAGKGLESLGFHFDSDGGESGELLQFEFEIIRVATGNFSETNLIGKNERGLMYNGRLHNGQGITVNTFSCYFHDQCRNEVSLLVKLEHKNLVQLIGYCVDGTTIILVYVALHASLDKLIFDRVTHSHLEWTQRYKIILGVAKGLLYLHKHRIVHRDVRPGNIFLDENLDPKLSDFTLARRLPMGDAYRIEVDKIVCAECIPPEYWLAGHVSTKFDVYSFGVLVLEIISGQNSWGFRRNGESFIQHAWKMFCEGTFTIDPTMDTNSRFMTRYIHIGLMCIQEDSAQRPTMDEVVEMLSSSLPLPLPKELVPEPSTKDGIFVDYDHGWAVDDDYDSGALEEFMTELSPR